MTVSRAFWKGLGFALPPSIATLALALWWANDWWLVLAIWLLCSLLLLLLADGAPTAESLGITDD